MSSIMNAVRSASAFITAARTPFDDDGAAPTTGVLAGAIDDMRTALRASGAVSLADAPAYIDAIRNLNGVGIDDRDFLLEKLVVLMSSLGADSPLGTKMQQFFIDTLYKDLPHPPTSFLGPVDHVARSVAPVPYKPSYVFRSYDGSNYTPLVPSLGMAGTPYARTVPSTKTTPHSALPDPGLIFDLLLRRDPKEPPRAHPGGMSAMFFAVANLVIHSIFDTDHSDWRINNTSSYMDLAPLYGGSKGRGAKQVQDMRKMDGTGKIWEDTFADSRLLFMPPATAAVLILLNRNHNYIAEMILRINEFGTYQDPTALTDAEARNKQDDEIFHRARLVNSGYFAKIVLHDYVGGILGLTRDGSAWRLDLVQQIRRSDHEFAPTGEGGAVSCEFNTLYRWHPTTSEPDAKWIGAVFERLCPGKTAAEVTVEDFKTAAMKSMRPPADVKEWTFGGLQRGADGRFKNDDLAKTIYAAINVPAHPFGARGVPECMRVIEIMTIEQNRTWGTCSLNDFRRFFGLRPWASFKEWNPDPAINQAAQALYGDIENLELHAGLQAEATKPPMAGAGLCPGYTVSRAILADAVVLTRSDKFLSTEMTPFNLTSWGYNYLTVDPNDGSYGGMFSKLLLRELPDYFKPGSGHAHFPLMYPPTMHKFLKTHGEGVAAKYDWTMTSPSALAIASAPTPVPALMYDKRLSALLGRTQIDRSLVDGVLFSSVNLAKWADTFSTTTSQLIRARSVYNPALKTRHIDIVQDVLNVVPIRFLAEEVLGLPLKTEENPTGVYREQELYAMFVDVANYLLANFDPSEEFSLRERAQKATQMMMDDIEAHLARLSTGIFSVAGLVDTVKTWIAGNDSTSSGFMQAVLKAGVERQYTHSEIAASLLAEVVATAAPYSASLAMMVDQHLGGGAVDVSNVLMGPGIVVNGSSNTGSMARFASSTKYTAADGLTNSVFFDKTSRGVLSTIFNLPNVQRVKGASGNIDKFTAPAFDGKKDQLFFTDNKGRVTAFPARLDIQYTA